MKAWYRFKYSQLTRKGQSEAKLKRNTEWPFYVLKKQIRWLVDWLIDKGIYFIPHTLAFTNPIGPCKQLRSIKYFSYFLVLFNNLEKWASWLCVSVHMQLRPSARLLDLFGNESKRHFHFPSEEGICNWNLKLSTRHCVWFFFQHDMTYWPCVSAGISFRVYRCFVPLGSRDKLPVSQLQPVLYDPKPGNISLETC